MFQRFVVFLPMAAPLQYPTPSMLSLGSFLSDTMVLQRSPLAARLWGGAAASAHISVSLDGKTVANTSAGTDGQWSLLLPPQPAGFGHQLQISDGSAELALSDVAFGDVFLCSGQSNMAFSLNQALNASAEIADSGRYPGLRLATVNLTDAATPQTTASSMANYTWARSGSSAFVPVGGPQFSYFSAVCFLFGRELYTGLGGVVPIGLVAASWGGVKIETLMSPDALIDDSCGGTALAAIPNASKPTARRAGGKAVTDELMRVGEASMGELVTGRADAAASRELVLGLGVKPSGAWNGMIAPLLRMRFTGVVWYQGESNSLAGCPVAYSCLFPALIADWRLKFELPELSFLFVQLAAYGYHDFTHLRLAQTAALQLPYTAMATAIDQGEGGVGNIHPRRKQEVGRRLALAARGALYFDPSVAAYEGPALEGVQLSPLRTTARLTFVASTARGLHLTGTGGCSDCCKQPPSKPWYFAFEYMAPNATWLGATVVSVKRNVIVLNASEPIAGVRHNFGGYPDCSLYNGAGGPDDHAGIAAPPFRRCLHGTVGAFPPWSYFSDCNPMPTGLVPFAPPGATSIVPTATLSDLVFSGITRVGGPPDAASSGTVRPGQILTLVCASAHSSQHD